MKELSKAYNPKETEDRIYKLWEEANCFVPDKRLTTNDKRPFTIVIPPPNVTGSLHMGHALNTTIQDILIRRSRMTGVPTLWVPGTDHAGIATQSVVTKKLAKEGINKNDLSREEFEKRIWEWVDEYGHIIIDQLKKIGATCDWSRQRFTLDDDYKEAVNFAFKHYYDQGLIYQGERVVNWCVGCQTAISDIEVEYRQAEGKLWYIKYPLVNSKSEIRNPKQILNSKSEIQNYITVATTRPETMLGDTAIAVNPNDKRYQNLIGKMAVLPIANREIPIIADKMIDIKFGTGAVKVTPAHDVNDYEIWQRHKEEIEGPIKIIDKYGKISLHNSEFISLKTNEAREKIVLELEKLGLIEKIEGHTHQVPHCYRCGKEIEPQPSKQWFLKMNELIKPAIEAIKNDEIKLTPTRWKKVYLDWMENIRDWCISRQIVWGHKIPIEGETDVLDTWFSSALWPFATLGWPKLAYSQQQTAYGNNIKSEKPLAVSREPLAMNDLQYFYPTTILSTARDINMLWVVRMIFSGLEFTKEIPFKQVYIHPTVFNKDGKRMSKSLGTGVDPLELIDKYGADAVRFGLSYINTGTQDIKFDETAILMGQKFGNKIWNISRFVLGQIGNSKFEALNTKQIQNSKNQILNKASSEVKSGSQAPQEGASAIAPVERTSFYDERAVEPKTENDKQILESFDQLINSVNSDLDNFRFGQAAHSLYDFIWHDLADVYIETAKKQLDDPKLKENTLFILHYSLFIILKLLHPFMPFLTEEIWQNLYAEKLVEEKYLIIAPWPEIKSETLNSKS